MAETTLFIDLDGVLLDVSRRYFEVHRSMPGARPLTKERYWTLKRDRAPLHEFIEDASFVSDYRRHWLESIEEESRLALDAVIPGSREALRELSSRRPLALATLRRDAAAMRRQLERLDLAAFFTQVLCAPAGPEPWEDKRLLLEHCSLRGAASWIVGDTEVDVLAGRALGMTTAAVLSGIRSRQKLQEARPDVVIEGLWELSPLIAAKAPPR